MKKVLASVMVILVVRSQLVCQVSFDRYFVDQTLRIDYYHTGDAKTEEIIPDKMYREGIWAGNPANLIQPFELGTYKVNVIDQETGRVIYSKGYSSIFAEYQTIDPALQGIKKTYHESVLIPCPKAPFTLQFQKRDRYNKLFTLYSQFIDPEDYHIINQKTGLPGDIVYSAVKNGDPHQCVDLVILGEGYTSMENDKFKIDLEYFTRLFFNTEPYKSNEKLFNVTGIYTVSAESGTDEPRQRIYRNSKLGSSFNYFDLDRYCLADDNKTIRDVAGNVPYDAILIMVNRQRYGGGGIYNWQTVFTAENDRRDYVFLHEFGHAFAGLADEYFSSPVSYVDFHTEGVEPLEPNITTLPDPANVKWKKYLSPGIPVPTDWGKARYDSLVNRRSIIYSESEMTISQMRKKGASETEIEKARRDIRVQIEKVNREIDDFFENHPLKNKIGVFEGANYMSKGMYRPTLMSLMHGFQKVPSYDTVNEQAIISTIRYYTE